MVTSRFRSGRWLISSGGLRTTHDVLLPRPRRDGDRLPAAADPDLAQRAVSGDEGRGRRVRVRDLRHAAALERALLGRPVRAGRVPVDVRARRPRPAAGDLPPCLRRVRADASSSCCWRRRRSATGRREPTSPRRWCCRWRCHWDAHSCRRRRKPGTAGRAGDGGSCGCSANSPAPCRTSAWCRGSARPECSGRG